MSVSLYADDVVIFCHSDKTELCMSHNFSYILRAHMGTTYKIHGVLRLLSSPVVRVNCP
jgi:hypothetical protein